MTLKIFHYQLQKLIQIFFFGGAFSIYIHFPYFIVYVEFEKALCVKQLSLFYTRRSTSFWYKQAVQKMQLLLLFFGDLTIVFSGLCTQEHSNGYWLNTRVENKYIQFFKTILAGRIRFYLGYFNQQKGRVVCALSYCKYYRQTTILSNKPFFNQLITLKNSKITMKNICILGSLKDWINIIVRIIITSF